VADIKFGTSGWRAIISEDFTFANVRLVTQAIADYLKKEHRTSIAGRRIIIGYDTRFLSKEFAAEAADIIAANKIKVLLCRRDTPTPVIAYHIIDKQCAGGINFTASHNPPHYNGIKFSPATGGPASPEITGQIESNIKKLKEFDKAPANNMNRDLIDIFDPRPEYINRIKRLVDITAIKKAKLRVACDCLYGTSRGYLDAILNSCGIKPIMLHDYLNPYFGNKRPEPARENITELIKTVKGNKLDLGLATDGDADRFGIVDSDGSYITPNEVITLLLYHFIHNRKTKKTSVARTVATTHMVDIIAEAHNIDVRETPVGFKYFVDDILAGNCIIAGEESGGLSISGHVPEKDGILACLLMAELRAIEKKPIRETLKAIAKKYGRLYSNRVDLELIRDKKADLIKNISAESFNVFAGLKINRRDTKDGIRVFLEDGSWVLFRPSGTEPVVRIYFESKNKKTLGAIEESARHLI